MPLRTQLVVRYPISKLILTIRGHETAASPQRTIATAPATTTRGATQIAAACSSHPSSAAPPTTPRGSLQATDRTERPRDTPAHTRGNQDTDRCAGQTPSTYSPNAPRRQRASDRDVHAVHHSRSPSRRMSDTPRDITRSEYTPAASALQRRARP